MVNVNIQLDFIYLQNVRTNAKNNFRVVSSFSLVYYYMLRILLLLLLVVLLLPIVFVIRNNKF
jgi:hypothetical protein